MFKNFIKRLRCPHEKWKVSHIEWDGTAHAECIACGKKKKQGLK